MRTQSRWYVAGALGAGLAASALGGCSANHGGGGGDGTSSSGTGGSVPLAQGEACSAKSECASGFCADGFCCDTACNSACHACAAVHTGATNGTCSHATNGTPDPRGLCATTAPPTCGTDGMCNDGACRNWPVGTPSPPECTDGKQTTNGTCDGTGNLRGTTTACAPYGCGSDACHTSCTTHADCGGEHFCWLSECTRLTAVGAGFLHTCALTAAGGVQCWGDSSDSILGKDSLSSNLVPGAVSGLSSGVPAVAAAGQHSCALTEWGKVLCWGSNFWGQLGNNSTSDSPVPIGLSIGGVTEITAGSSHTIEGHIAT